MNWWQWNLDIQETGSSRQTHSGHKKLNIERCFTKNHVVLCRQSTEWEWWAKSTKNDGNSEVRTGRWTRPFLPRLRRCINHRAQLHFSTSCNSPLKMINCSSRRHLTCFRVPECTFPVKKQLRFIQVLPFCWAWIKVIKCVRGGGGVFKPHVDETVSCNKADPSPSPKKQLSNYFDK